MKNNSDAQIPPKKDPRKKYYRKRYKKSGGGDSDRDQRNAKKDFRKISVLVPLLNEEESLESLFNEITNTFKELNYDYEILFMDDGSTDNSLTRIKNLRRRDNRIRYISFRKNYGKSAALNIGFQNVTGDVVITMDADLQDDPHEIPILLKKLGEGFDLVSGWKRVRHDPFVKKHTSKFFNFVTRVSTGIDIHDFNCGLKAYRTEVVKSVRVYGELHRYIPVLADWQGFSVTETEVKHHPRRYGKTKFGLSRFFKGFVDLLTVLFNTRYIRRPMHLFGFLGALSFIAGLIINIFLSYEWIFQNKPLSNRPLLFLGILLIIVGVQFFSIGLLGEILVHNFKDDKEYHIKERS